MRKSIIWICILFLLAVPVFAVSYDFQQEGNAITINYKDQIYIRQNRNYNFYIHAFNSSVLGGDLLTDVTTSCTLHLYNATGNHLISTDGSMSYNNGDFGIDIEGGNFSATGTYPYVAACLNGNGWGFVGGHFIVTESGEQEIMADSSAGIAIVIFILTIAISLFVLSMKKDILKNKYSNIIVRRSLLVLGIYLMILNSAIMATIAASSNLPLVQEMFFYMKVIGYAGYPAMLLLMMSALITSLQEMKQDKRDKRTGAEEDGEQ